MFCLVLNEELLFSAMEFVATQRRVDLLFFFFFFFFGNILHSCCNSLSQEPFLALIL